MDEIILEAPAKVNIGLLIKGKRADGYHLLETLLYPIELADSVRIRPAKEMEIVLENFEEEVPMESNLVYKAWKQLSDHAPELPPVSVTVTKNIPAGGGLGGGSSDAAATMRGLNELFGLGFSTEDLMQLSRPLGADVPWFFLGEPALATGIGQELEPFRFSYADGKLPFKIRLITPPIHSSTPAAYKGLEISQCDPHRSLKFLLSQPTEKWKNSVVNDLEGPVFKQYPELKKYKEQLYGEGAVYAAMSGSGAVIFGLFEQ